MSVSNVQSRAGNSVNQAQSPQANGSISDMFLKLLVAQINNQDPTNPTDSAEYINQLAQISQTESMQGMTSMMSNVAVLVDNIQLLSTSNLVGQHVYVASDKIELQEGQSVSGRLQLEHPANTVTLHIKDSAGQEVKLELQNQEAGDVNFEIDAEALGLKPGKYSLSVVTDTGEENVPIELAGTVNSVRIDAKTGTPMLTIPGLGEVAYVQVRQFGDGKTAAADHENKPFTLPSLKNRSSV